MDAALRWIAEAAGATDARRGERIQALWRGYGELFRVQLAGARVATAVVKWVQPPAHLRAARDDASHARKCRSYDVELRWYRAFGPRCDAACRVPTLIAGRATDDGWVLVLEDLDAAGFPERRRDPGPGELERCLAWLAALHARFLGVAPDGLWEAGTYWHLATRPDELAAIDDPALREAAPVLDRALRACRFRTIVHGDAKPANFCFAPGGRAVAAVDFQYAGGGCGVQDVAYLLGGRTGGGSDAAEARWLEVYFGHLRDALAQRADAVDAAAVEAAWRALYPVARADFYRFLAGWARPHWRSDARGQRHVRELLRTLG